MEPKELFSVALGLVKPWKCERVEFAGEPRQLRLNLDFERGSRLACPQCQVACPVHDTVEKQWRHLNFFQYECQLVARVPRVKCEQHGVHVVAVPWAREGSGFTLLFEALVMMLAPAMPMVEVAEMVAEQDTRLWRVVQHYVEEAQAKRSWAGVKQILVDETSAKRGHRYVTNFVDAQSRELLFMVEGKGSEGFAAFAKELPAHGGKPEQIELIGMDMSAAFRKGAKEQFPAARVVFDHFHLMQWAGQAVDEVRQELRRNGAEMKGGLWALRGNEHNHSEEQKQKRAELCLAYPKIGRALALRDYLQDALQSKNPSDLQSWLSWAQRSRLKPFQKLAKCIKAHWDGILAFLETRLTNGLIEAINGLLQLAKRLARGFRSFKTFQLMGYLKAGKLKLNTPSLLPT
jgi:transposase